MKAFNKYKAKHILKNLLTSMKNFSHKTDINDIKRAWKNY
jgi:hypothetical protein